MTTEERSFQKYFIKTAGHCQRVPSDGLPGVPDVEVIRGLVTYRVELKILKIGPSGDKKLSTVFKMKTQPPYYAKFLAEGGEGLYVLFRLEEGYGLLEVDMDFVRDMGTVKYSQLPSYRYRYYKVLQEVINDNFG